MQEKSSFPPEPCQKASDRAQAKARDQFFTRDHVIKELLDWLLDKGTEHGLRDYQEASIIEPSAGEGAFLVHLPSRTIAFDKYVEAPGIIHADFFKVSFSEHDNRVFIGNPPFGRNASLAIKFVNHAALYANVIAFVLPLSFQKVSVQNRIDLNLHLVDEMLLPKKAFLLNGEPEDVPTVFQIWARKDTARKKIILPTNHVDFEFTNPENADFGITRAGGGAGRLHWDLGKSPQNNYFIRPGAIGLDAVLKIMKSLDLQTPARRTAGQYSLSKTELVDLYTKGKAELDKV